MTQDQDDAVNDGEGSISSPAAADPFAAARAAYRARLTGLAAEVERQLDLPSEPLVRAELSRLAHRLIGTAGCYGFTDISAAAERLHGSLAGEMPWGEVMRATKKLAAVMKERAGDAAGR